MQESLLFELPLGYKSKTFQIVPPKDPERGFRAVIRVEENLITYEKLMSNRKWRADYTDVYSIAILDKTSWFQIAFDDTKRKSIDA